MPLILLLVPFLELLGLLGFIYVASISSEQTIRYLPFFAAGIGVLYLALRRAGSMSFRQIVALSIVMSLEFVVGFQILGVIFTGLAKDLDMISLDNLTRLALILGAAIVFHFMLLIICHFLYRRSI